MRANSYVFYFNIPYSTCRRPKFLTKKRCIICCITLVHDLNYSNVFYMIYLPFELQVYLLVEREIEQVQKHLKFMRMMLTLSCMVQMKSWMHMEGWCNIPLTSIVLAIVTIINPFDIFRSRLVNSNCMLF